MAEIRHEETAVYEYGDFFDRYGGRMAIMKRVEGIVIVYMDDDNRRGREGWQYLDCETVIGGRLHRMVQRRPPSQRLTETGAKRVVTKWLREVACG